MNRPYKVIDLFCGCGGFSQGFIDEGFEIFVANEIKHSAIKTFKRNHPNTIIIEGDITDPRKKNELYDAVANQKIDVIIGGPPCVAYSTSGNRNPDDPRGQLYLDFIDIINHLKPDFFVMENVKGLLNMKHVKMNLTRDQLQNFQNQCVELQRFKDLKRYSAQRKLTDNELNEFNRLKIRFPLLKNKIEENLMPLIDKIILNFKMINYRVKYKLLNSADFGVAQIRERIIFIGTNYKNQPDLIKFPESTHSKTPINTLFEKDKKQRWITSKQVLQDLEKSLERPDINHVFTVHKPEFIEKINKTNVGANVFENYNDAFWRLDPNRPSRTVKENHGGVHIHYAENRVCTPRELARLQSFKDSFIFEGSKSLILKQIGNAVPPLLAKAIAKEVKSSLNILNNVG